MTAMTNSPVREKISAESRDHNVVVDLLPQTTIVEDRTCVPKELRNSLAVFGDSRWELTPLVQKKTLSTEALSINFDTIPAVYRETAKRLIWCYINVATPVADLTARPRRGPNSHPPRYMPAPFTCEPGRSGSVTAAFFGSAT